VSNEQAALSMSDNKQISLRRKKRHSHIYISLSIKIGFQWKQIKALDWNEDGFNFFIDHEIPYSNVLFKKGQAKFAGQVMWIRQSGDRECNHEMVLNTLLYNEIDGMTGKDSTFERIVKMMRTEGLISEKKRILLAMNPDIHETEIDRRIREHEQDSSGYRYGVKVSSQEWADITRYALEASAVVDAMDRVGKGISQLADTMDQEDPPS
jgi:hypothetical protein